MGAGHHHHTPSVEQTGQSPDFRKKLWIAFGITAIIVVVQLVGTIMTGSLALLTDTVHAAGAAISAQLGHAGVVADCC